MLYQAKLMHYSRLFLLHNITHSKLRGGIFFYFGTPALVFWKTGPTVGMPLASNSPSCAPRPQYAPTLGATVDDTGFPQKSLPPLLVITSPAFRHGEFDCNWKPAGLTPPLGTVNMWSARIALLSTGAAAAPPK